MFACTKRRADHRKMLPPPGKNYSYLICLPTLRPLCKKGHVPYSDITLKELQNYTAMHLIIISRGAKPKKAIITCIKGDNWSNRHSYETMHRFYP